MHGQAKVKGSEAEKERKKKEREAKVLVYRKGMEKAFEKRNKRELDDEALRVTGDLLLANPDIYTLWNFRKEILLSFKEKKSEEELKIILESELKLSEGCLKVNPKSYCSWHHRLWLIDNLPKPDLRQELRLSTLYLQMDERNLHCWDYRRAVVDRMGVPANMELDFTMTKINENFSNYSSWHYRSKLLPKVHPDPEGTRPVAEAAHRKELELVQSAAFTDPADSSAWFYQRWLLGGGNRELSLVAAFLDPTRTKATLAFSRPTVVPPLCGLCVHGLPDGCWLPFGSSYSPHVWVKDMTSPASKMVGGSEALVVGIGSGATREDALLSREQDGHYTFTCDIPDFGTHYSPALVETLTEQLASSRQLLELEPNSKWSALASVLLMQAIDRKKFKDDSLDCLKRLKTIDYSHAAYYSDLRSKYQIEYALEEHGAERLDRLKEEFVLRDAELTELYHMQYLLTVRQVDLSGNLLGRALPRLAPLLLCRTLLLDRNGLTTLKGLPSLPSLTTLSVRDNKIRSWAEGVSPFVKQCPRLTSLDITGNPIQKSDKGMDDLTQSFSQLLIINGN